MANHVGLKLSRLIRERAYLGGSLPVLEKKVAEREAELNLARQNLQHVLDQINTIDKDIAAQSAIDASDIRPIRRTPRRLQVRHGTFTRELLGILRESPSPLSTEEIIRHMAEVFNLPRNTPIDRDDTRRRVTKRLRVFVAKNAIERLHEPTGNGLGLWRWIGGYGEPDGEA